HGCPRFTARWQPLRQRLIWRHGGSGAMAKFLSRARQLIRSLQPHAQLIGLGSGSARDWLPPVLGPSDWSLGLLEAMADSNTAWYFDARPKRLLITKRADADLGPSCLLE